jgi:hypothetical protein
MAKTFPGEVSGTEELIQLHPTAFIVQGAPLVYARGWNFTCCSLGSNTVELAEQSHLVAHVSVASPKAKTG